MRVAIAVVVRCCEPVLASQPVGEVKYDATFGHVVQMRLSMTGLVFPAWCRSEVVEERVLPSPKKKKKRK